MLSSPFYLPIFIIYFSIRGLSFFPHTKMISLFSLLFFVPVLCLMLLPQLLASLNVATHCSSDIKSTSVQVQVI